jgi:hypothetical protein
MTFILVYTAIKKLNFMNEKIPKNKPHYIEIA